MIVLGLVAALAAAAALALAVLLRIRTRALAATRAEAGRFRALAKDRAKRIAMLSHEVRTPLALIRGAGELLADESAGPLTSDQRRFTETITTNCSHVVALAESLLTQARLEARLFDLTLRRTDVRALVRATVHDLRRLHPNTIQLDSHGPAISVLADPRLLREALWNLGNNAVRHAGSGARVTVRISEGEEQVVVSVSDDGNGIAPNVRTRMFDEYQTTAPDGTGLGMTITKAIVELHGGTVLVDTAARRGTTIYFTIPTGRGPDDDDGR